MDNCPVSSNKWKYLIGILILLSISFSYDAYAIQVTSNGININLTMSKAPIVTTCQAGSILVNGICMKMTLPKTAINTNPIAGSIVSNGIALKLIMPSSIIDRTCQSGSVDSNGICLKINMNCPLCPQTTILSDVYINMSLNRTQISPSSTNYSSGMLYPVNITISRIINKSYVINASYFYLGDSSLNTVGVQCTDALFGRVTTASCSKVSEARISCNILFDAAFNNFDIATQYVGCVKVNGTWFETPPGWLKVNTTCGDSKRTGTEQCDPPNIAANCSNTCSCNYGTRNSSGVCLNNACNPTLPINNSILKYGAASVNNQNWVLDQTLTANCSFRCNAAANFTVSGTNCVCLGGHTYNATSNSCRIQTVNGCAALPAYITATPAGYIVRNAGATSADQAWIHDFSGTAACSFRCNNTDTGNTGYYYWNSGSGRCVACTLLTTSIALQTDSNSNGRVDFNDRVRISGTLGGNCTRATHVQVDAGNGGTCLLRWTGGQVSGLSGSLSLTSAATTFSVDWTSPAVPSVCADQIITASVAAIRNGTPSVMITPISSINTPSGSFRFGAVTNTGCGNGVVVSPETCDDGVAPFTAPAVSGDGCSATCLIERCGDSIITLTNPNNLYNLASAGGLAPPEVCDSVAQCTNCRCNARYHINGLNCVANTCAASPPSGAGQVLNNLQPITNGDSWNYNLPGTDDCSWNCNAAANFEYDGASACRCRTGFTLQAGVCVANGCAALPAYITSTPLGYITNVGAASSPNQAWIHNYPGTAACSFRCNNTASGGTGYNFYNSGSGRCEPCALTVATISFNNNGDGDSKVDVGEVVTISGTVTGNCSMTNNIQIDARSVDSLCRLQWSGGQLQGVNGNYAIGQGPTSFTTSWTVPAFPASCVNKLINAVDAGLRWGNPGVNATPIAYLATAGGSFTFDIQPSVCGNNILEASGGEECDDGNLIINDGCSATCKNDTCIVRTTPLSENYANPTHFSTLTYPYNVQDYINFTCANKTITGFRLADYNGNCNVVAGNTTCLSYLPGLYKCNITFTPAFRMHNSTLAYHGCIQVGGVWQRSAPEYLVMDTVCGDRIISHNEDCDPFDGIFGNSNCSAISCTCPFNYGPDTNGKCKFLNTCGNKKVDAGEECDDGNTLNGDGCEANCKLPSCDCSVRTAPLSENSAAPTTYAFKPNIVVNDSIILNCNGLVPSQYRLADYNGNCLSAASGTNCIRINDTLYNCTISFGPTFNYTDIPLRYYGCLNIGGNWLKSPAEFVELSSMCGDGLIGLGENCDPGAVFTNSNCSNVNCRCNFGYEPDGNKKCRLINLCGNSRNDAGEQCDDGNRINGDGCEANCQLPQCICEVQTIGLGATSINSFNTTYASGRKIYDNISINCFGSTPTNYFLTDFRGNCANGAAQNVTCTPFASPTLYNCSIALGNDFLPSNFDRGLAYYGCALIGGRYFISPIEWLNVTSSCGDTKVSGNEQCDPPNAAANCSATCACVPGTRNVSGVCLANVCNPTLPSGNGRIFRYGMASINNQNWIPDQTATASCSYSCNVTANFTMSGPTCVCLPGHAYNASTLSCRPFACATPPLFITTQSIGYVLNYSGATSLNQLWVHNFAGTGACSFRCNNSGYYYYDSGSGTCKQCALNNVSIALLPSGDFNSNNMLDKNDIITMYGNVTNNCTNATNFQIDANNTANNCTIAWQYATITSGINGAIVLGSTSQAFTSTWILISDVPNNCSNQTVRAVAGAIRRGVPSAGVAPLGYTSTAAGQVRFGYSLAVCGNNINETWFGETCDDGNIQNGDGCSAACKIERCGDNILTSSNSRNIYNLSSTGGLQPPEACDPPNIAANCSNICRCNYGTRNISGVCVNNACNIPAPTGNGVILRYGIATVNNQNWVADQSATTNCSYSCNLALNFTLGGPNCQCLAGYSFNITTGSCMPNNCTALPAFITSQSNGYITNPAGATTLNQGWVHNYAGAGSCSFKCNNSAYFYYDSGSGTCKQCTLNNVSIALLPSGDFGTIGSVDKNDIITMYGNVSNNCSNATNFQIDASNIANNCTIAWQSATITGGINGGITLGSGSQAFTATWTMISDIPANCSNQTVRAIAGAIRRGLPIPSNAPIGFTSTAAGQFKFGYSIAVCGNNINETWFTEQCDDGNIISGDGCSNACQNERCGDNIITLTNPKYSYVNASAGGLAPPEQCELPNIANCSAVCRCNFGTRNISGACVNNACNTPIPSASGMILKYGVATVNNQNWVPDQTAIANCSYSCNASANFTMSGPNCVCLAGYSFNATTNSCMPNACTVQPAFITSTPSGYLLNSTGASSLNQAWVYNSGGIAACSWKCNNSAFFYYNSGTGRCEPCQLTDVGLSFAPGGDLDSDGKADTNDIIRITGQVTGNCSNSTHVQVDANDTTGICRIMWAAGAMQGISGSYSIGQAATQFITSWTVPTINPICALRTVNPNASAIRTAALDMGGVFVSYTLNVHGGLTFDYPISVCNNSITEPWGGEQCDDGNNERWDGCNPSCQMERCGDVVISVTNPNGFFNLSSTGGQWPEECEPPMIDNCDSTCQCRYGYSNSSADCVPNLCRLPIPNGNGVILKFGLAEFDNQPWVVDLTTFQNCSYSCNTTANFTLSGVNCICLPGHSYNSTTGSCMPNSCTVTPGFIISEPRAYIMNNVGATSLNQGWIHNYPGTAACSFKCNNTDSGGTGYYYWNSGTGRCVACTLSTTNIALQADAGILGRVDTGDTVRISGTLTGNCSAAKHIQVDAGNGGTCLLRWTGGQISGLFGSLTLTSASTTYSVDWTTPAIPAACGNQVVTATSSGIRIANPSVSIVPMSFINTPTGSIQFGPSVIGCGDGFVTGIETCDDGGALNGDGCSATCLIERCGDSILTLTNPNNLYNLASAGGLAPPEVCDSVAQCTNCRCNARYHINGLNCDANTCAASPPSGPGQVLNNLQPVSNGDSWNYNLLGTDDCSWNCNAAANFEYDGISACRCRTGFTLQAGVCVANGCAALPVYVTSTPLGYITNVGTASSPNQGWIHNYPGTAACSFKCNNTDSGGTGYYYWNPGTGRCEACTLSTTNIALQADAGILGRVDTGDTVRISGTLTGNCSTAKHIQVDAGNGGTCLLRWTGGQISGLFGSLTLTSASTTYSVDWTTPAIPAACGNQVVTATSSGIRIANPSVAIVPISFINTPTGSIQFGPSVIGCGDGFVTGIETCDDGGTVNGDGCNAICQIERCGDAAITLTNPNNLYNLASAGGLAPPEVCDSVAQCTNCRCNARYHINGLNCDANTCAAGAPAFAGVVLNNLQPVSNGDSWNYNSLGIDDCSWNCNAATNFEYDGVSACRCRTGFTLQAGICVANGCAALPGYVTSTPLGYITNAGTATSPDQGWIHNYPGTAACSFRCNNTDSGGTGYYYWNLGTGRCEACILSTTNIALQADAGILGRVDTGDTVRISGTLTGNCSTAKHIQVDAGNGGTCLLRWTGGQISGLFGSLTLTSASTTYSVDWTTPAIPAACGNQVVTATSSGIRIANPSVATIPISFINTPTGSIQFGPSVIGCGDGFVTGIETCDDGGTVNGDGCNAICQIERCGDAAITLTNPNNLYNLASAGGLAPPEVCDSVAQCTNCRCNARYHINGLNCDANTCAASPPSGPGQVLNNLQPVSNGDSWNYNLLGTDDCSWNCNAAANFEYDGVSACRCKTGFTLQAGVCVANGCAALPGYVTAPGYITNVGTATSPNQAWIHNYPGTAACSFKCNNTDSGSTGYYYWNSGSGRCEACTLSTTNIALQADAGILGRVDTGDTVRISGTLTGNCSAAKHIQVDAGNGGTCLLRWTGGQISGLFGSLTLTSASTTYSVDWTTPAIPAACGNQVVTATSSGIRIANPSIAIAPISFINTPTGSIQFGPSVIGCGDGFMTGIETCDDGGTLSGDGCSATCLIERCGDSIITLTNPNNLYNLASAGGLAPPEVCDSVAQCTNCRCNARYHINGLNCVANICAASPPSGPGQVLNNLQPVANGDSWNYNLLGTDDCSWNCNAAANFEYDGVSACRCRTGFTLQAGVCLANGCAVLPGYVTSTPLGYITNTGTASSPNQGWIHNYPGTAACSFKCNNTDSGGTGYYYWNSGTGRCEACTLTGIALSLFSDAYNVGVADKDDIIEIRGTVTGNCSATKHIQVDASDGSSCTIAYTGADMSGIYNTYNILSSATQFIAYWGVGSIANDCLGKTVSGTGAGIRLTNPVAEPAPVSFTSTIIGNFQFASTNSPGCNIANLVLALQSADGVADQGDAIRITGDYTGNCVGLANDIQVNMSSGLCLISPNTGTQDIIGINSDSTYIPAGLGGTFSGIWTVPASTGDCAGVNAQPRGGYLYDSTILNGQKINKSNIFNATGAIRFAKCGDGLVSGTESCDWFGDANCNPSCVCIPGYSAIGGRCFQNLCGGAPPVGAGYIFNTSVPSIPGSPWRHNYSGIGSCTFQCDGSQNYYYDVPMQICKPCLLVSAAFSLLPADDLNNDGRADNGERITMDAVVSGNCSITKNLQIDAYDGVGGNCDLTYSGGSMSGLNGDYSISESATTLQTKWAVPNYISPDCEGRTIIPFVGAAIRNATPITSGAFIPIFTAAVSGTFTFCDDMNGDGVCENSVSVCGDRVVTGSEVCDPLDGNFAIAHCILPGLPNNCTCEPGYQKNGNSCSLTPPDTCFISFASISIASGADGLADEGDKIAVSGSYSGNCNVSANAAQVSAINRSLNIIINYTSPNVLEGINAPLTFNRALSTFTGTWTVPAIPPILKGVRVVASMSHMYNTATGVAANLSVPQLATGAITFAKCGDRSLSGAEQCEPTLDLNCSSSCMCLPGYTNFTVGGKCLLISGGQCDVRSISINYMPVGLDTVVDAGDTVRLSGEFTGNCAAIAQSVQVNARNGTLLISDPSTSPNMIGMNGTMAINAFFGTFIADWIVPSVPVALQGVRMPAISGYLFNGASASVNATPIEPASGSIVFAKCGDGIISGSEACDPILDGNCNATSCNCINGYRKSGNFCVKEGECSINDLSISIQGSVDDIADVGEIVRISGIYTGNCDVTGTDVQVSAWNRTNSSCNITYYKVGRIVSMPGINGRAAYDIDHFEAEWTVSYINDSCQGARVIPEEGYIYNSTLLGPDRNLSPSVRPHGYLLFADCGDGMKSDGEVCEYSTTNLFCIRGNLGLPNECKCQAGFSADINNVCVATSCGDGILQPGEDCDDNNLNNEDDCLNTCEFPSCGDGFTWLGHEDCDSGLNNGMPGYCLTGCHQTVPPGGRIAPALINDHDQYYSSESRAEVSANRYRELIKYHSLTYKLWTNDVDNPLRAAYSSNYNDYISPDNCLQSIQDGQECYQLWYLKSTDVSDTEIFDLDQDISAGRASPDNPLKNLGLFVRYDYKGMTKVSPGFTFRIIPSRSYVIPYNMNPMYSCLVLSLSPLTNLNDWNYDASLMNSTRSNYNGKWSCTGVGVSGCTADVAGKFCNHP